MNKTFPISNKKFEEHINNDEMHGLGLLDYTNGVLVDVSKISEDTPYIAPSAGELIGPFQPKEHGVIAYAVINGNTTSYRSSNSLDYASNRDCFSIKLYKDDSLYFVYTDLNGNTLTQNGDGKPLTIYNNKHYFYPYVNKNIVNLTDDDLVSREAFNSHVNDVNQHYTGLPIGTVIWWAGGGEAAKRPAGFLLLDGSSFDETEYPELYEILGKTNVLPNYIGRFVKGSEIAGVSEEAGLPNITGKSVGNGEPGFGTGALLTGSELIGKNDQNWFGCWPAYNAYAYTFDASRGTVNTDGDYMLQEDSPYGKSNTVTPENISAVPLIKAKHYASVYAPASLDETLRTEHNTLKDTVAELSKSIFPTPDYSQIVSITEFPHTCSASGIIYLSWSIDNTYCVIPTVNGKRLMAFSDSGLNGGFTSTFSVGKGDVVDFIIVTDILGSTNAELPKIGNISNAGTLEYGADGASWTYLTGKYNYVMYARFVPYTNNGCTISGNINNIVESGGFYKAMDANGIHSGATTDPDGIVRYNRTIPDSSKSTVLLSNIENTYLRFYITENEKTSDIDLGSEDTLFTPYSGYTDIGNTRIIYGISDSIARTGSVNNIVRIKLPITTNKILSVTTSCIMTGREHDDMTLTLQSEGIECSAQILRIIDDYLYVYIDGHVKNVGPSVMISYNIVTTIN